MYGLEKDQTLMNGNMLQSKSATDINYQYAAYYMLDHNRKIIVGLPCAHHIFSKLTRDDSWSQRLRASVLPPLRTSCTFASYAAYVMIPTSVQLAETVIVSLGLLVDTLLDVLAVRKLSMFSKAKNQSVSLDFSRRGKKTMIPMPNSIQCKGQCKFALFPNDCFSSHVGRLI